MRGPLPVYVEDPVARLRVVREAMDGLKESKQAVGAEVLAGAAELRAADDPRAGVAAELLHAPVQPARHQRARARSSRSTCSGASCRTCSRSRSCPSNHALAVAIMSYNGGMDFGLLGDYDAMPDLDALGETLEDALEELLTAAKRRRAQRPSAAAPKRAAEALRRGGSSVAERELRVLGHLVRGPRRREDHRRDDLLDARRSRRRTPPSARRPAGRSGTPGVVSVKVTSTVPPSISTP